MSVEQGNEIAGESLLSGICERVGGGVVVVTSHGMFIGITRFHEHDILFRMLFFEQ